jgi:hypothetical protein
MSAAAVREAFRDAVAGLLTADDFTFIESVNLAEATADLPLRWYTLDFIASDVTRLSLGSPALFRETGTVVVIVFTPPQIEDASAVAAAEVIRTALGTWTDDTGQIRVLEAGPPNDLDGGDFRGSFYGVTVDLRYQHDRIE